MLSFRHSHFSDLLTPWAAPGFSDGLVDGDGSGARALLGMANAEAATFGIRTVLELIVPSVAVTSPKVWPVGATGAVRTPD